MSANPYDTNKKKAGFVKGILLTLLLALVASQLSKLPFFSIMGIMILSILLGMIWRVIGGIPKGAEPGITFSSKILLRVGIILMGLRLNFAQILDAGFSLIAVDVLVIIFTITLMITLGKWFSVDRHLSALIAVGTAVCGAAAIVAVAPLIQGKKEYTAISVAFIAIMGTIGTLAYSFLYPFLGLDSYHYGILVGATLHELAHVIAAAVPGGDTSGETAILVKLGRVALLIPVAMILGYLFSEKRTKEVKRGFKDIPIPWFIFGFLAMSLINTTSLLSESMTAELISLSVILLSMAMAGLGLGIHFGDFKKVGINAIMVGLLGFLALICLGTILLQWV